MPSNVSDTGSPRSRRQELAARREALVYRSTLLREQVLQRADQLDPWVQRWRQLQAQGRWMASNRHALGLLAGGAAALGVLLRPRRTLRLLWRWAPRAWALWRAWQRLQTRDGSAAPPASAPAVPWVALAQWMARRRGR